MNAAVEQAAAAAFVRCHVAAQDDATRALDALEFIAPPLDREEWVKLLMAAHDAGISADAACAWSERGPNFDERDFRSTWRSIKPGGGVTAKTLFRAAIDAGWRDTAERQRLTREQQAAYDAERARRREQEAEAKAEREAAAAVRAGEIWEKAQPATDDHPYLVKRGVKAHGLKVGRWERLDPATGEVRTVEDALLIQIRDMEKKTHSIQAIFPSQENAFSRDRDYLPGGAKQGHFFPIGQPKMVDGKKTIVVCEGYSTAASIHECTGHAVVVAFDKGNLEPVANVIRNRLPDADIVIFSDRDAEVLSESGGTKAALKAALAAKARIVVPEWCGVDGRDANDVHAGGLSWGGETFPGKDIIDACVRFATPYRSTAFVELLKQCGIEAEDGALRASGIPLVQHADVDVPQAAGAGGDVGQGEVRDGADERPIEDTFLVDQRAPFDTARQLIARNWLQSGARTIHRAAGAFFFWCGTHYQELSDEAVRATLYSELDAALCLADRAPFKPDSTSVGKVEDALRAAAHLPGDRPSECWIGAVGMPLAKEIVSVSNGLLHLPTRTLLPHDPRFFTMNSLPFAYSADAPEPVEWRKFLGTIWPNDPESIGLLQRWFGYMLSADTSHQKMLLLIGPKRSGKGTIARIMTSLLGKPNVAGPTLSDFANQFGLAQLVGRRAAIIGDARLSGRVDQGEIAGRLLSITGEDTLTIDRKHREPWIGSLPTRIVICSNELPRLHDASGALSSRFLVLQMEQSFYGKEDRGLGERIEAELPGILNWALAGWDALQREGRFPSPQSSMDALDELEGLSSPVKAFIDDVCEVNASAAIDCTELYDEWRGWCETQGRDHPGNLQTFGRDLRAAAAGVKTQQYRVGDGSRSRRFIGIGLRSPI